MVLLDQVTQLGQDQVPEVRPRTEPWPLYTPSYRERNQVERLADRLKNYHRVATWYAKLAATFLGFVHLTLAVIRLT